MIDEDVAYLHSVHGPRPAVQTQPIPLTNGFVSSQTQQEPGHNGLLLNGTHGQSRTIHAPVETENHIYSELPGSRTPVRSGSPVSHRQRQEEVIVNGTTTPGL